MHAAGLRIFFVGLMAIAPAGCQAPSQPSGPTMSVLRIPDYEAFFDSALTLLREHDFHPRLVDRAAGLAVTHPSTGAQWFEFWRGDSRGGYQLLESSLHTVRRSVRLSVQPEVEAEPQQRGESGSMDRYRVGVEVYKERFSSPQRQVTTASGALQIYSERLPTEEGLRAARVRGDHWVPLGRDALLEKYLLSRLQSARIGVQVESAPEAESGGEGRSPGGRSEGTDGPVDWPAGR